MLCSGISVVKLSPLIYVFSQDFGLAYEHERRVKHQSLWFSEIRSTLYGYCVRVHLLDVADWYISAEKKAKLLEQFQLFQEPAIITISVGVLSPDHMCT